VAASLVDNGVIERTIVVASGGLGGVNKLAVLMLERAMPAGGGRQASPRGVRSVAEAAELAVVVGEALSESRDLLVEHR
jgi:hypothetical protein